MTLSTTIKALAAAEHLAVVSDFDGTLSPFATAIYEVEMNKDSLRALDKLAHLPHTTAAVLSGRHLAGLQRVCPLREPVLFGGSHGAESSWEETDLTPAMREHLTAKETEIRAIMERFPGADIEVKPFQRVLHLRALELMGASLDLRDGYVHAKAPAGGLKGAVIDFPLVSVGATENALMAASLAAKSTGTWPIPRTGCSSSTGATPCSPPTPSSPGMAPGSPRS